MTTKAKSAEIAISARVQVTGNKGPHGLGTVIRIDGEDEKIANVAIRLDTGERVDVKPAEIAEATV